MTVTSWMFSTVSPGCGNTCSGGHCAGEGSAEKGNKKSNMPDHGSTIVSRKKSILSYLVGIGWG